MLACFIQSLAALLLIGQSGSATAADAPSWRGSIAAIVETYCIECHDGPEAEAGLDFTRLGSDLENEEVSRRWVLIHDRITTGEMPPEDHSQPTRAEREAVLSGIAQAITRADRLRDDVVLRRLNRVEYENTVRDLFEVDHLRVKELLPEDTPSAGFDNVGEGLAVSPEAMQAYLRAADVTLDAVFGLPAKPRFIEHTTNLLDQKTHDGKPFLQNQIGKMFRKTDDGLVIFQSGYCPTNLVNFARLRAPAGTYRGKMRVRAIQSEEPVTLRIYGGDTIVGRREKHLVGYFDVMPNEWSTIVFEDRLVEDGGTFQPKCYGTRDTRKDADTYPEPGIEIGEITLEGPLEAWPPPARGKLLGDVDVNRATVHDARAILTKTLPRAYRRPTTPDELDAYVELVEAAMSKGRSFEDSLRLGLKAVLCSPEFLFLDEPTDEEPSGWMISQHALASRLSYFLWSSMPDEELLTLAARQRLSDPKTLRAQVERLLADLTSNRVYNEFHRTVARPA